MTVLLVVDRSYRYIGTVRAHIAALRSLPQYDVRLVDYRLLPHIDITSVRAIILHYTVTLADLHERYREPIRRAPGVKLAFVQDEYRWVDRTAAAIADLGVTVLFSCVEREQQRLVYRQPSMMAVRIEETLTGYVDPRLLTRRVPAYHARRIDLGYRARKLPEWYGELGRIKWQIAESVLDARPPLKLDISTVEGERLYGRRWVRFIEGCKAMLGTESGASVVDHADVYRTGTVPWPKGGQPVVRAISPRVFEAAALRTLLVLTPGEYGGRLVAGRHYVELAPDMDNLDDVVTAIKVSGYAERIIRCAYREVACAERNQPEALARHVGEVIAWEARNVHPVALPVSVRRAMVRRWREAAQEALLALACRARRCAARHVARWARWVPGSIDARLRPVVRRWLLGAVLVVVALPVNAAPWVCHGQTWVKANATVIDPEPNRVGVLGECERLPYRVPEGRVLRLDGWGVEGYAGLPGGVVMAPWVGDKLTNGAMLPSVQGGQGRGSAEYGAVRFGLPPGTELHVMLQNGQPRAVFSWFLVGGVE